MIKKTTKLAVLALFIAVNVQAMECPVSMADGPSEEYVDRVVALYQKQKDCSSVKEIAEACAFGSQVDGVIVGEAVAVCDRFINNNLKMPILKAKTTKAKAEAKVNAAKVLKLYGNTQSLCDSKYAEVEGTIGVSVRVFCYLDIAYLFSNLTEKSAVGAQD
jgi:hypothetical protein